MEESFTGIFYIRLVIKHPVLSLDAITNELHLEPSHGHSVGEPRKTPAGRPLSGVWRETFWGYTKACSGRRDFVSASIELLETLNGSADFFRRIRKEKGLVAIYVDLMGCENFRDTLTIAKMAYFQSLGVDFGVEVFGS
jgi:hypothetical protein